MGHNEIVEYDGKCAFALSLGKIPPDTSGKYLLTKNGKTYSFSNLLAKFLFNLSSKNIEKADRSWKKQNV